jgi:hypothetical protein
MSPEQLEGKPVDQRSDIYSLGLVAYEMLTGRAAFVGNTPASVAARQLREAPPSPRTIDPSIPANVEAVILRCLERDPARRYASLDELIAALPSPEATTRDWDPRPGPVYIMSPGKARALLLVIQTGYLALYVAALYHLDAMTEVLKTQMGFSPGVAGLAPLIAMASIAVRIYLFSALAFNHPATGRQYWRMCLGLLVLDELWAFAPLLLVGRIPLGLALVFTVGLAYLPFGQKTLFSNAYPEAPASLPVSSR